MSSLDMTMLFYETVGVLYPYNSSIDHHVTIDVCLLSFGYVVPNRDLQLH